MTTKRTLLAISVALAALLGAQSAQAWDRGHGHARIGVGFYFGVPYGGYYYPPYPYYYPAYYPPVVVQQQPTVYVEQQPAPQAQSQQPAGYWYYCADSRAYYPYVKQCATAWQRVSPQPQ